MPFADPERKKQFMKEWRKRSIKNGYGKWLYARRSLRFQDADHFRETLEAIAEVPEGSASILASKALEDSEKRWLELGPPPGGDGRPEPPKQADDTLLEALAKLGLSN